MPDELQPPELDQYIREKQLLEIIPISSNALAAQVAAGTFPAPVKIGLRSVAYNLREVREWLRQRTAERDAKRAALEAKRAARERRTTT
jgi:prophage regulatory protein